MLQTLALYLGNSESPIFRLATGLTLRPLPDFQILDFVVRIFFSCYFCGKQLKQGQAIKQLLSEIDSLHMRGGWFEAAFCFSMPFLQSSFVSAQTA